MSKMIVNPKDYFRAFIPERDAVLRDLECEALEEGIPIVGPVVGELLYILARVTGAQNILELGTATGYSTIYLARACQEAGGRILSIERSPEMAGRARENLGRAGLGDIAEIRLGDADEIVSGLEGPFDLVFMDIDKEYYPGALPHCRRLLKLGGLLFTDNVGFTASEAFNRAIFDEPAWRVVHLLCFLPAHSPEEDGLSLAVRVT
jgi:caffeoyl-CoA O-methyltransferase